MEAITFYLDHPLETARQVLQFGDRFDAVLPALI
jgi:hypothetical protein